MKVIWLDMSFVFVRRIWTLLTNLRTSKLYYLMRHERISIIFFLMKRTHWVLLSSLSYVYDVIMRCMCYMIAKRLCEQLDDLNLESWQVFHKTFKRKTTRIFNIKLIESLNTKGSHIVLRDARIVLRDARIEMRDSLIASFIIYVIKFQ